MGGECTTKLFALLLVLGLPLGMTLLSGKSGIGYQHTRKLLAAMRSPLQDKGKLATLFRVGDERIGDLLSALDDTDEHVAHNAQLVIRYLGTEAGMRGLLEWYGRHEEFPVVGAVPVPLREWDYKVMAANYIDRPARDWTGVERYIYALALDDSPRARLALGQVAEIARDLDEATVARRAIRSVQMNKPAAPLTGPRDLAKLVLENAFFVPPPDRKYASARVLGFNASNDKALIEVYINRGVLAEEWYHVVIRRYDRAWKFFSVTPVGVS
ncbi:MAG TPA: hypothetical protein VJH03_18660 [Blastocatellia bacterium]|nr:hypothetical protein [Blastocatellia bacterium]